MNHYYNKNLKEFSRQNRKKQTKGEALLWKHLRGKQLLGLKFYRQRSIDKYIVDFLAPEISLIVEIDGSSHDDVKFEYDQKREAELRLLGFKILRFTEYEVCSNINAVLTTVENYLYYPSP